MELHTGYDHKESIYVIVPRKPLTFGLTKESIKLQVKAVVFNEIEEYKTYIKVDETRW